MKLNLKGCCGLFIAAVILIGANVSLAKSAADNAADPSIGHGGPPPEFAINNKVLNKEQFSRKWLDVAYAKGSKSQVLDIYLPEKKAGPFPVLVVVHGGGWELGDKSDSQVITIIKSAVKRGYAVASVNYRLSGEASFPAQIYDVKAAIRFLRANAAKYSLNPEKIGIWGNSAGGHLAALAGTSGGVAKLEDLKMGNQNQSSRVNAVVTWFGAFDLTSIQDSRELKKLFKDTPTELKGAADVKKYITKDDPPFLIQHGSSDTLVPVTQSVQLATDLYKVLGKDKVKLDILLGEPHGGSGFETPENIARVFSFLDPILK
ncbi:MAG: hypothetical protein H6Q73_2183 [Firmicutes bacterium]|nr:hypothetical protein [Bacillota bacterium]